ncbi:MAG: pitrilysin family protein [Dehalococcoidia bacterium]
MATGDIIPFPHLERTLANGLRVITVNTGFPHLVSLQIPVQTGSRNEVEPGKSGFAHFFEHMMFRGTKRFPPDAYQAILTRTGARQNAYTTDDYTNYHVTCAAEDLETILELEADRFMNLEYSEADFRTEALAILGEYNKSASDPLTKLLEVQREAAFTTHTYKHVTMGFLRDIEDMPNQFAYSRTFFERWYRPEYTTVIVAGDLDIEATAALIERHWGAWQPGAGASVAIPQEPPQRAPVTAHVPWPSPTLPWVTVAFHGPAFSTTDPSYTALDVLLDLHFGETSDLYRRLVEQEQKVDQLFPYLPSAQDAPLASVMARVKDPADCGYVRDAIAAEFAAARAKAVDAGRLADAKANARYSFARTLDNSDAVAATLARYVRFERSFDTLNALFRAYDALTTDDVLAAARRFITDENLVLTTLSEGVAPAGLLSAPAVVRSAAATVLGVPVVEQRSPSGQLRFKLLFTVGSAHDPAGKEGLAQLAAAMVADAGSERMRIDEITRALFPMAGSFGARVDREMTTFSGVIHRDNLGRFLDLVLPQLTAPGFREEDFARLKDQQRSELTEDLRANNDEELGKERLQALVFAGSGYGHPAEGTVTGIDAITLDDVRAWVAERFVRANLTLGLAGDFPEDLAARLKDEISRLPTGSAAPTAVATPRAANGIEVEVIEKETRAVAVSFGHAIRVTRAHPDFAALWLARSWLGEHRASNGRLYQRLRELRGLNYGDYAYIEAFPRGMYQFFPDANMGRHHQLFEVWLRPLVPATAVFALKLALYELRQLIANGIPDDEFEATRAYLMKNVYLMTKTQDQQLGYALDSRWHGMGDFVAAMRERLAALTATDVDAAIRRHLSGENLTVVMVAKDAAGLRDELLSGAPSSLAYESPKPDEVLAEDAIAGALELGLSPTSVRITRIEDVFAG